MTLRDLRRPFSAALMMAIAVSGSAVVAQQAWRAEFPTTAAREKPVTGTGERRAGQVEVKFDTLSPLLTAASPTGRFRVARPTRQIAGAKPDETAVIFSDSRPALLPGRPGSDRFYRRAQGTISALAWVDTEFKDVEVTAIVNITGGPRGRGSQSAQGVMARWDKSTNFYWFHVDFAAGHFAIERGRSFGVANIEQTIGDVKNFDARNSYRLQFRLVGPRLRGQVFDMAGNVVGDTGDIEDKDNPQLAGVSGFLGEQALKAAFAPLEASFMRLESRAIQ